MGIVEPSIRSYSIRGPCEPRLTREGRHHARGEDEETDEVVILITLHRIGRGTKRGASGRKERSREGKGMGYRMGRVLMVRLAIDNFIRVNNASGQMNANPPDHPLCRSDGPT